MDDKCGDKDMDTDTEDDKFAASRCDLQWRFKLFCFSFRVKFIRESVATTKFL